MMKWFQHDSDAHRDLKLKKLYKKYGLEGLGLYWIVVEMIASDLSSKKINCELEWSSDFLAEEFKLEQMKVDAILNFCCEIQLFDRGQSGNIRCIKLLERLDNTLSKSHEIGIIKSEAKKFIPQRNAIPRQTVIEVAARCGAKCSKCGSEKNLQIDHIVPLSKGGKGTSDNLQVLCGLCNVQKKDSTELLLEPEEQLLLEENRLEEIKKEKMKRESVLGRPLLEWEMTQLKLSILKQGKGEATA